ncbi:MAG: helix-turn-helix domain-containing protein [Pseudomonadota bacterium]
MADASSYHHGDLRNALLKLATARIAKDGVDAVSVRALAREAGVAHRAAYQHFADKEALIAAAITAAYERLRRRLEKALKGADGPDDHEEALTRIAVAYAAFAFAEPQMFLAMTGPRLNTSGAYPELEAALRRSWRLVTTPISEGAAAGRFIADGHLAAALYWGGLQGVISQCVVGRIKLKASERKAFFMRVGERLVASLKA